MKNILRILLCITLMTVVGCTNRNADYEAARQLENAIIDEAFDDFDHVWQRVDSAEQAGLFKKAGNLSRLLTAISSVSRGWCWPVASTTMATTASPSDCRGRFFP